MSRHLLNISCCEERSGLWVNATIQAHQLFWTERGGVSHVTLMRHNWAHIFTSNMILYYPHCNIIHFSMYVMGLLSTMNNCMDQWTMQTKFRASVTVTSVSSALYVVTCYYIFIYFVLSFYIELFYEMLQISLFIHIKFPTYWANKGLSYLILELQG